MNANKSTKMPESTVDEFYYSTVRGVSRAFSSMIFFLILVMVVLWGVDNHMLRNRMDSEPYQVVEMESSSFIGIEYGRILVRFQNGDLRRISVDLGTYSDLMLAQ